MVATNRLAAEEIDTLPIDVPNRYRHVSKNANAAAPNGGKK